jgi:integrase
MYKKNRSKGKKSKPFDSYTKYALTDQEIDRCLEKCDTTEKECIMKLGFYLGLRRSDMAGLRITNVDFVNHSLHYLEEKKGEIHTSPMPNDLELCLKKHINAGATSPPYLFKRASGSTMYRRFQEILDSAGIVMDDPKRRTRPFHALRGTCYKYWQRRNMPVEQIAKLLGDTAETAMKHYGQPTNAEIATHMNVYNRL